MVSVSRLAGLKHVGHWAVDEPLVQGQRRLARGQELGVLGQQDRQDPPPARARRRTGRSRRWV